MSRPSEHVVGQPRQMPTFFECDWNIARVDWGRPSAYEPHRMFTGNECSHTKGHCLVAGDVVGRQVRSCPPRYGHMRVFSRCISELSCWMACAACSDRTPCLTVIGLSAGRWRTAARFGAMAVAMHSSGVPLRSPSARFAPGPITMSITYHILPFRVAHLPWGLLSSAGQRTSGREGRWAIVPLAQMPATPHGEKTSPA